MNSAINQSVHQIFQMRHQGAMLPSFLVAIYSAPRCHECCVRYHRYNLLFVFANKTYCKIWYKVHQNLNVSRLVLQLSLPNPLRAGDKWKWRCSWSTTGVAPTTSKWSTILLPTKVQLMSEVWQYFTFWLTYYLGTPFTSKTVISSSSSSGSSSGAISRSLAGVDITPYFFVLLFLLRILERHGKKYI